METKRNFSNHFQHTRFASGYDQNQLIVSDVSYETEHRVELNLMNILPKWDKRNNQR